MPAPFYDMSGRKVTSIDMGLNNNNAFVTELGELFTWGEGRDGVELNQRNTISKLVEGLSGKVCKQVSCSQYKTTVVAQCGRVYTFFSLGRKFFHPTLVKGLETKDIIEVQHQCGKNKTMALSRSGLVYACDLFTWRKRRLSNYFESMPCVQTTATQRRSALPLSEVCRALCCIGRSLT